MSETPLLKLPDIRPKMELQGVVKRIELGGAVLDVGAEVEALLHISQIQEGRVKNVGDHLQENKEVTVWVRNIDQERGQISVTMIKPAAVTWDDLAVGQVHQGKVIRLEKFGVFVDIGAERPGLVHVSELASEYVAAPGDVVKQGAEVEVKVIGVNRRKNQIDLSIKALETPIKQIIAEVEEQEQVEEQPTAMALALQRAQKNVEPPAPKGKQHTRRQSDKQEEILRRTLERMENQ